MNSTLWIRKLVVLVLIASTFVAGCDKARTIAKLENIATELRMHNRSILKITNDSFAAGKVSRAFHGGVLTACENFSKALNGADAAIIAAKKVTGTDEARSALDFIERLLDVDVFPAFLAVAEAVIDVPPEIKAQIETILASVRLLFSALRAIFADAQIAVGGKPNYA